MLEIRTFGGLSLRKNGEALKDLGSHKAEAILVYIAVGGRPYNRNVLASLLWSESPENQAQTSLRVALSLLRKPLGDYLEVSRETVSLNPDSQVYLDVSELETKLDSHQVEQALEIYRGDFLQGFYVRDSLEFEEWRRWQEERLRRLISGALQAAITAAIEMEDYKKGQALIHQLLELDPLDELAHRQCMLLFALDGKRVPALTQYEKCRAILQAELGVEPSRETQVLFKQISQGIRPISSGVVIPPQNLPAPQTSFIGREPELAQIEALIGDPACRLLTLMGPGGIGKTRLALQAASKAPRSFSDGTYFVPLDPVVSPDYLVHSIAGAIQFNIDTSFSDLDPKYQLLDYLRNRSILLVMDSFEHLIPGAGLLADVISHAPKVKILVTSRQRLDLKGEWTFPVNGLPIPSTSANASPDNSSALRLFVERARQAKSGSQLSKLDLEHATRICRFVEGMPLAIELAAAWTSMLTPEEIAEEIHNNLDFLNISSSDIPEKHHSLRAAFESSWLMLNDGQREAFCKLSIFQGGFDRQAALQVTGISLTQLSALLDKSMLGRNMAGRYYMHGILRQYAFEKLNAILPGRNEVYDQHCRYYLEFLSQREADLNSQRMFIAQDEIRQEMDNIRSAVNWAVVNWEAEKLRKVLNVLLAFYTVREWHEGKDAFNHIAQMRKEYLLSRNLDDSLQDTVYLSARIHQAFLQCNLGQIDESETISRECFEPLRSLGLHGELSECLQNLGVNASFRGEYSLAMERLEEAILLGRDCQHSPWLTYLLWLGHAYFLLGEYEHGLESLRKCYELFDRRGNLWGMGFALSKMGLAADGLGEFTQAMQYHRQALSIFEKTSNQAGKAYAKSRMSMAAYFLEEYDQAIQFGQEGYDIFQLLGHRWGICTSLCRLGFAFIGKGDIPKAESHFYEALEQSRKNQMIPVSLYALAGLASTLACEGEGKKAIHLLRYVKHQPQIPALYLEQAVRCFKHLDQTLAQNEPAPPFENVELNEVIERFLKA